MTDNLLDGFFHSGTGYWTLFSEVRERAPALPANPTVALGLVAIARAEPLLPPARRHAAGVLAFLPADIRTQVCRALRDAGLVVWRVDGSLSLTDDGKAIAAALRGAAAPAETGDWIDLPPVAPAPTAATAAEAAEAEEEEAEEEEIPPPPGVPEDEADEATEAGAIAVTPAVPGVTYANPLDQPPAIGREALLRATVHGHGLAADRANPAVKRKPIVNREPPGVPRY